MTSAITAAIFDVDGVLVDSPHERAWREALSGYADPARFTTGFYQAHVAGKPRLAGARAALEGLGVADAATLAPEYAEKKQALIDQLIEANEFTAFPDALRFVAELNAAGLTLALASSSKNAEAMLRKLRLPDGRTLLSAFAADLSGREVPRGKPDPALFLLAAEALATPPSACVVIEDAPAGIQAARAGGMAALGIARLHDEALLDRAGAGLVVTSLDQVDVAALVAGALRSHPPVESLAGMLEPTPDPDWVVTHEGYSVHTENAVESRFAFGNGFIGMRAARSISRGPTWTSWLGYIRWASWPRCYVAGLFDIPNTEPPVPALVPVADWSRVTVTLNGHQLLAREGEMVLGERTLDMRRGLLISAWTQRTPAGVTVAGREIRLLSLANRAIGLQLQRVEIDRGDIEVGAVASFSLAGVGMDPVRLEDDLGSWRTEGTGKGVAMAGHAVLRLDGEVLAPQRPFPLRWNWNWRSKPGQVAEFGRMVAIARGDAPGDDPAPIARQALTHNLALGWRAVLKAHIAAWDSRWVASDVRIEGDDELQRAVRFAIYHLTSAANPDDETVSVGARGLTGDAYFGHVFWDTEIYLLPFYTLSWPEAARALLMYRHRTLPAARAKAARSGYRGALYAWESADTGEETTPETVLGPGGEPIEILTGKMEHHISADVAYAVWRYWQATGDDDFFSRFGAEIVLETARFWASRAMAEPDGKRHIRHVIGPDEYHEDVDDNAFTNVMARWNIARGLETLDVMRARWPERAAALKKQLALGSDERADWRDALERIPTGFDPATGLYEQFEGYNQLEAIDLAAYAHHTVPLDVVLGRERTQRSQVVKQADVVALLGLLPEALPGDAALKNFRHYEPRCGHGSSLSASMHALVAARLGDPDLALRYIRETAALDLDPDPNTAGGVRIAGLGGLWQAVVLGFGGVAIAGETLAMNPKPTPGWRALSFRLHWRERVIQVRLADGAADISLVSGAAMALRINSAERTLTPGSNLRVPI